MEFEILRQHWQITLQLTLKIIMHDAINVPSVIIFFVLKAVQTILEYHDLFFGETSDNEKFEGIMLVPSKHERDQRFQSNLRMLASDMVQDIISSKRDGKLTDCQRKKEIQALSQIGMAPISIKYLESYLDNNEKEKDQTFDIHLHMRSKNKVSIRLPCLNGE